MAWSYLQLAIFLLSHSLVSAIDARSSTFTSSSPPSPSSTFSVTTHPMPLPFSSEALKSPHFYSHLSSITQILGDLGFHDLSIAAHSLSLSSASHIPWIGPITVFAPADSSLRSCPSCSLSLLLQEHTVPGLYPHDYLNRLVYGTKIETILPGRCLTVTSSVIAGKLFIGGAELTHPHLYVSHEIIIHGLQGFISHVSPHSCSTEKLTSLYLPRSTAVFTHMMLADAMIRLRTSGYSVLALAMRVKYAELVTLHNMTIFAVEDSSIFHGGHAYVHTVRYHVIPNRVLKLADLEKLPVLTVLPTLESGEALTVTTPGGGGLLSPMRINYVKINYPNLIHNLKVVVHGLASPFPRLRQSIAVNGRSEFVPVTTGEFGSGVTESNANNMHQTSASSSVMKSTAEMYDVHQGF